MNKITLHNPITINGKTVSELSYDTNEITAIQFAEADAKRKVAAGMKNVTITPAVEFDFGLHLYLGYAAVIAVNPDYDFSDLERIHGADIIEFMGVGRNFLLKSEGSQENSSDEQSETTPEPSTPALQTSKKSE